MGRLSDRPFSDERPSVYLGRSTQECITLPSPSREPRETVPVISGGFSGVEDYDSGTSNTKTVYLRSPCVCKSRVVTQTMGEVSSPGVSGGSKGLPGLSGVPVMSYRGRTRNYGT